MTCSSGICINKESIQAIKLKFNMTLKYEHTEKLGL